MPFDRLIRVVDDWAGRRGREDVFAQIGDSELAPRHIEFVRRLEPAAFRRRVEQAKVVVAHAGTGSIFAALQAGKPIVVMPRRAELRETRNDHQLATAQRLCPRLKAQVAANEQQLSAWLDRVDDLTALEQLGPYAPSQLTGAIRDFLLEDTAKEARGAREVG